MKDSVSATGYTSVILVMNMRRFIAEADLQRFERMRSSPEFRDILRHQWRDRLEGCGTFDPVGHDDDARQISQRHEHSEPSGSTMSTEEVGFLTGIFRQGALDQYSTPTYYLKNKAHVQFPDEISYKRARHVHALLGSAGAHAGVRHRDSRPGPTARAHEPRPAPRL